MAEQADQYDMYVSLSVIFYVIHCYNNLASSTQSQMRSQSQKATTVKSPIGSLSVIFYIIVTII